MTTINVAPTSKRARKFVNFTFDSGFLFQDKYMPSPIYLPIAVDHGNVQIFGINCVDAAPAQGRRLVSDLYINIDISFLMKNTNLIYTFNNMLPANLYFMVAIIRKGTDLNKFKWSLPVVPPASDESDEPTVHANEADSIIPIPKNDIVFEIPFRAYPDLNVQYSKIRSHVNCNINLDAGDTLVCFVTSHDIFYGLYQTYNSVNDKYYTTKVGSDFKLQFAGFFDFKISYA